MAAAKRIYVNGKHTVKQVMKSAGSIQSQAKKLRGSNDAQLDKMILSAIDGTGSFAKAKAAGASGCPARKEFIVKSIQNNLFSKMTINMAQSKAGWNQAMRTTGVTG